MPDLDNQAAFEILVQANNALIIRLSSKDNKVTMCWMPVDGGIETTIATDELVRKN